MESLKIRLYNTLRRSEKYFKTDMVYLAKGGSWMAIGTVASGLIAFASSVAFANLLSKESYGTYQYVLGIIDIFGIAVLSGIDTAVARSVAQGKDGSLVQALTAKIRWGLIGGAASGLAGAYYYINGNDLLGGAFLIAMILIPFWEAPGLYIGYLQGKKRFDLMTIYETISQMVATVAIIISLFATDNILVILTAYLASWGIMRGFFLFVSMRQVPPNAIKDSHLISYGKHLTFMSAASVISSNIDKVLLWHFLGPVHVAVYIFAQAIPMRITGAIKSINRLAFPKMAGAQLSDLQSTLVKKVIMLSIPSAFLALLYILIAPLFFSLFFPQYQGAVFYSQLVSLVIILQPFSLLVSSLTAQAQKRSLYSYHFGMPIVRVILFLTLIPAFHLLGAIIALVIIKIIDALLLLFLFKRARSSPPLITV